MKTPKAQPVLPQTRDELQRWLRGRVVRSFDFYGTGFVMVVSPHKMSPKKTQITGYYEPINDGLEFDISEVIK